jgi:hypothetical protein
MSDGERAEMARRSAGRVLRDSTWSGQALRTLVAVYPGLADLAVEVADTLDRADRAAVASPADGRILVNY